MPIYEYKCRQCGVRFEKLVRSTTIQKDLTCPACLSPKVERQVSLCGCLAVSGVTDSGAGPDSSRSCAPSGGG
jgi:putative FmdB family regulatory protein